MAARGATLANSQIATRTIYTGMRSVFLVQRAYICSMARPAFYGIVERVVDLDRPGIVELERVETKNSLGMDLCEWFVKKMNCKFASSRELDQNVDLLFTLE